MTARPRFRPRQPPKAPSTTTTRTPTSVQQYDLDRLLAEFDALYAACGEDPTAAQVAELQRLHDAIRKARA